MKNLLKITLTLLTAIVMSIGILRPEILLGTPASPAVGNWYQQFMPDLNGATVSDVIFIDSLNGFMVASHTSVNDTCYILKTTNAGDSWVIKHKQRGVFTRVVFINNNTGYTCGSTPGVNELLFKTTNSGDNWSIVNTPNGAVIRDMHILSEDTMWIVHSDILKIIYRTTNGGASWEQQFSDPNPLTKVYMHNSRLGFFSTNTKLYKTTNSGLNWNEVIGERGFLDIYFADSLTGWKADFYLGINDTNIRKTTNGGISWIKQRLPVGGVISSSYCQSLAGINKDTLFAVGGYVQFPNGQYRGIIYRTINGGYNWQFQIPDTSINIPSYAIIDFINKNNGWAFIPEPVNSIHTTDGGDPVWITAIEQISTEVPTNFQLFQNYPNPFNPRTVIPYKLKKPAYVRLIAYEITGKETQIMVDQHQQAGEYEVDFMGKFAISSGVYFYRIEVTDDKSKQLYTETKKMLLIK